MLCDTLWHNHIMWEGYRPKMLLYTQDELFYIYNQVKRHRGINEKIVVAYEIISFVVLHCTDTMPLVNLNDTRHLEHLAWAVYNRALCVGNCPELRGECQWCTVLAGIFQHIYKGRNKTAHCLPYTLVSWNCQQRTDVVCEECRQNTTRGGHDGGHRARGQGLRSGPRRRSKTPSVDISEEEPETLGEIDANWRAKQWLEVATPLTSGAEGTTKALAKCLVAAWRWNIKV